MLDVGCGPIFPDYPFLGDAEQVVCIDWNVRVVGDIPKRIEVIEGNFLQIELPQPSFDVIICSDVFEHIPLEQETAFAQKCIAHLADGGALIVSTPHAGRYARLDPYQIKPMVHRWLHRLGLYSRLHNGSCDIRKGHKHYRKAELAEHFVPLRITGAETWGYLYDPLLSWADAIAGKLGGFPMRQTLQTRCAAEYAHDYGDRAFNIALRLQRP